MGETRPNALTAEELARTEIKCGRYTDSSPQRIPPGTTIGIEAFQPAEAVIDNPTTPTFGPAEVINAPTVGRGKRQK